MSGHGIFISYRREDTRGEAGRLDERLRRRYGAGLVFRDVHDSPPGTSFPEHLERSVTSCLIVIVVVGARWLESLSARLEQPTDWVRFEIRTALSCPSVTVIPVLMHTEAMPRPDELPDDIRPLSTITAQHVSDDRWEDDMRRLFTALDPLMWPHLSGQRVDRLPTSWTGKMRLAVAAWVLIVGIAAAVQMFAEVMSGSFTDSISADLEPVVAPGLSAEEHGDVLSMLAIFYLVAALIVASSSAFLALLSYRGWYRIFWLDLLILGTAASSSFSDVGTWWADAESPGDLLEGLPAPVITVTALGLFVWMIVGMIRFGPGAWSTRRPDG